MRLDIHVQFAFTYLILSSRFGGGVRNGLNITFIAADPRC